MKIFQRRLQLSIWWSDHWSNGPKTNGSYPGISYLPKGIKFVSLPDGMSWTLSDDWSGELGPHLSQTAETCNLLHGRWAEVGLLLDRFAPFLLVPHWINLLLSTVKLGILKIFITECVFYTVSTEVPGIGGWVAWYGCWGPNSVLWKRSALCFLCFLKLSSLATPWLCSFNWFIKDRWQNQLGAQADLQAL